MRTLYISYSLGAMQERNHAQQFERTEILQLVIKNGAVSKFLIKIEHDTRQAVQSMVTMIHHEITGETHGSYGTLGNPAK